MKVLYYKCLISILWFIFINEVIASVPNSREFNNLTNINEEVHVNRVKRYLDFIPKSRMFVSE